MPGENKRQRTTRIFHWIQPRADAMMCSRSKTGGAPGVGVGGSYVERNSSKYPQKSATEPQGSPLSASLMV